MMNTAAFNYAQDNVLPISALSSPTRILIVGGPLLMRECLSRALRQDKSLRVVTAETQGVHLESMLEDQIPDIVLIGSQVPGGPLLFIQRLKAVDPAIKVLVHGITPDSESEVLKLIEAGAGGFVSAEASLDELEGSLRALSRGETLCPPRLALSVFSRLATLAQRQQESVSTFCSVLSAREMEVLQLMARGLRNKEIGQRLYLSVYTVKNHVHNILGKLEVKNRRAAVALAHEKRWLLPQRAAA